MTVQAGELKVGEDDVEHLVRKQGECGFTRAGSGDVVSLDAEDSGEEFSHDFVVVNDQDAEGVIGGHG